MATEEKVTIKSAWLKFIMTQLIAFFVYSVALASLVGKYTTQLDNTLDAQKTLEVRVSDIDRNGTQKEHELRLVSQNQEERLRKLEDAITTLVPEIKVTAEQVREINSKLDKIEVAKH